MLMRTRRRTSCLVAALLFLASIATAGIGPGDDVISFNIGYATGKAATSGSTVDGPGLAYDDLPALFRGRSDL